MFLELPELCLLPFPRLERLEYEGSINSRVLDSLTSHAPRLDLARADDTLLQTISQLEPAGLHHLLSQLLQDHRYHTTHHVIIRASIR